MVAWDWPGVNHQFCYGVQAHRWANRLLRHTKCSHCNLAPRHKMQWEQIRRLFEAVGE